MRYKHEFFSAWMAFFLTRNNAFSDRSRYIMTQAEQPAQCHPQIKSDPLDIDKLTAVICLGSKFEWNNHNFLQQKSVQFFVKSLFRFFVALGENVTCYLFLCVCHTMLLKCHISLKHFVSMFSSVELSSALELECERSLAASGAFLWIQKQITNVLIDDK